MSDDTPLKVVKYGYPISVSWEMLLADDTPEPRVDHYEPVSPERMAQHKRAKKLWKELKRNPFFHITSDGQVFIDKPHPKPVYKQER